MASYPVGRASYFSVFFKADILHITICSKKFCSFIIYSTFPEYILFATEGEFANAPAQFDVYKKGNYDDVPLK